MKIEIGEVVATSDTGARAAVIMDGVAGQLALELGEDGGGYTCAGENVEAASAWVSGALLDHVRAMPHEGRNKVLHGLASLAGAKATEMALQLAEQAEEF